MPTHIRVTINGVPTWVKLVNRKIFASNNWNTIKPSDKIFKDGIWYPISEEEPVQPTGDYELLTLTETAYGLNTMLTPVGAGTIVTYNMNTAQLNIDVEETGLKRVWYGINNVNRHGLLLMRNLNYSLESGHMQWEICELDYFNGGIVIKYEQMGVGTSPWNGSGYWSIYTGSEANPIIPMSPSGQKADAYPPNYVGIGLYAVHFYTEQGDIDLTMHPVDFGTIVSGPNKTLTSTPKAVNLVWYGIDNNTNRKMWLYGGSDNGNNDSMWWVDIYDPDNNMTVTSFEMMGTNHRPWEGSNYYNLIGGIGYGNLGYVEVSTEAPIIVPVENAHY